MLVRLRPAALVVLAVLAWPVSVVGARNRDVTVEQLKAALYQIDSRLPLNASVRPAPPIKDESPRLKALRTRYLVTFDSVCDQRVPGILAVPRGRRGQMPAVLLLAGSGGHKDTDYVRLTSDMLNTLGIVTLSIDAQYHGDRSRKNRSGDIHLIYDVTARDAWVQTVRDLRRAVDYLCSRQEVDPGRIGFLGFSQGAMLGGTFLGVEPRVRVACLAVPGGGFSEWARRAKLVKPQQEAVLDVNAALTDPVYFVGRFAPRPLLILAARKDELIPAYATTAIEEAAGSGKQLIWYNSGHVLPPNALLVDAKQFFQRHLFGAGTS